MADSATAEGRFACCATRLFDGTRVLADHAVLVANGVVSAVLPRQAVPAGMPVWQEPDCTILPGLVDTHVHFMRWQGPLFLAHGVTTVRDVGNDLGWILARRREWAANAWPRLLCVGPLLDGPAPVHRAVSRPCLDAADARAAVRETVAAAVDGIKLYVGLDPGWLPAMAQEGHTAGLRVSMHCAGAGVLAAGRAGIDEFFHLDGILADLWPTHPPGWLGVWGLPEFARTRDRQLRLAEQIRALGLTATPTLAYWDSQWRIRTAGHLESAGMRRVPRAVGEAQGTAPADPAVCAQCRRALDAAQRFVGLLAEMGVPLLAGSDVPCGAVPPGLSLWRELSLLAEAGLSPMQALHAATAAAADFLGQADLGRLRSGAVADLVLVRGNPLARLPETPDVVAVVQGGTVRRPDRLLAAAAQAASTVAEDPWGVQLGLPQRAKTAPGPA